MIKYVKTLIKAVRMIKRYPIGLSAKSKTQFFKQIIRDRGMLQHHKNVVQYVNSVWVNCVIDYFRRNWPANSLMTIGVIDRMAKELDRILSYPISDEDKQLIAIAVMHAMKMVPAESRVTCERMLFPEGRAEKWIRVPILQN